MLTTIAATILGDSLKIDLYSNGQPGVILPVVLGGSYSGLLFCQRRTFSLATIICCPLVPLHLRFPIYSAYFHPISRARALEPLRHGMEKRSSHSADARQILQHETPKRRPVHQKLPQSVPGFLDPDCDDGFGGE